MGPVDRGPADFVEVCVECRVTTFLQTYQTLTLFLSNALFLSEFYAQQGDKERLEFVNIIWDLAPLSSFSQCSCSYLADPNAEFCICFYHGERVCNS